MATRYAIASGNSSATATWNQDGGSGCQINILTVSGPGGILTVSLGSSGGSGYPNSYSNLPIAITGGGGTLGYVLVNTNGSGVVTSLNGVYLAGSGYSATTNASTGGYLPANADTVLANSFFVNLDVNQTFGTITTAATGSGATVTFTVTSGVITGVTTTPPAGGTAYPISSTFPLLITGGSGTGGYVTATTNSSGVITSYASTPATVTTTGGSGATVTFTVSGGAISAVTATPPAGGSGYQPSATFPLLVTGGGGSNGYVTATTNASGVVTSFATTTPTGGAGTGYSGTTGAATGSIAAGGYNYTGTTGAATSSAGGGFILPDGSTLTAIVVPGTTTCLIYAGTASATTTGNVTNTSGSTSVYGISLFGTGTLTVNGNVSTSGAGTSTHGINNSSAASLIVVGNVTGSSGGNNIWGINNTSTGSVTITGNVTSGSTSQSTVYGLNNTASGNITVTGNVTGGTSNNTNQFGISNSGSGNLAVTGNVTGGNNSFNQVCPGINQSGSGTVTINGNVSGGSSGSSSYGINISAGSLSITGNLTAGGAFGCVAINNTNGRIYVNNGGIIGTASGAADGTFAFASNNFALYNGAAGYTTYAAANAALNGYPGGSGATVTFAVSSGALSAITTTPAAGGSGYPASATFTLGVSGGGGTGGFVTATTNSSGVITSYSAAPAAVGSGYTGTTGAATTMTGSSALTVTQYGILNTSGAAGQAATADVRSGKVYGPVGSTVTGTLAVPAASSVAYGVAVDATTGTAVLTLANVAQGVWNALTASYTLTGSFGAALGSGAGGGSTTIRTGTCQAGSTSSTVVFDAGASATNNLYLDSIVLITGGTGAGQNRSIQSYVGSTQTATVFPNWTTTPDNTSTFDILPGGQVDVGNVLNGTPTATASGVLDVNAKNIGGTSQTGADIAGNSTYGLSAASTLQKSILSAVSNIAVTGAALNATAASSTYTTGTSTGGYTNTYADDGVYDAVAAVGNAVDFYYQFSLGSTGQTAVGITWTGYVVGTLNTINVYAYNWAGTSWDQVGTIAGISGTSDSTQEFDLTSAHTGTGGNLGLVRFRFAASGLVTATVNTDRILCGYAVVTVFPTNFSALGISSGGVVNSNVQQLLGTGWLTPGTAGTPDVNVKLINAISTSSVTTINAYIGTTQNLTFDGNNLLKVDLVDVGGTAATQTGGILSVNAAQVGGQTASAAGTVTFPGTIASTSNITGGTITLCQTLTTYTGNTPQTGDSYAINNNATYGLVAVAKAVGSQNANAPGAANGLLIAGTNAGTTFTSSSGAGLTIISSHSGSSGLIVGGTSAPDISLVGTGYINADIYGRLLGNTGVSGQAFAGAGISSTQVVASVTGAVGSVTGAVGSVTSGVTVTTNNDKTGYALTSAYDAAKSAAAPGAQMDLVNSPNATALTAFAAAIWNALTSGITTVGSIGLRIVNFLTGDAFARLGAPAGASVSADIAAVKTSVGTPQQAGSAVTLPASVPSPYATSANQTTIINDLTNGTYGLAALLSAIDSQSAPTVEEIDTQLSGTHGSGAWGPGSAGSGAINVTPTINDGTNPIEGATITMKLAAEYNTLDTAANGQPVVPFTLLAGTWSVRVWAPGYTPITTTLVVGAVDLTPTYSLTLQSLNAPSAGCVTAYSYTFDGAGNLEANVAVVYKLIQINPAAGQILESAWMPATSNSAGLSQMQMLLGSKYLVKRTLQDPNGFEVTVSAGQTSPYELPAFIARA